MRKRDIHGSWTVTEQTFLNEDEKPPENVCIVGAEFQIHKDGDVIWKPHPHNEQFPFMKSENFRLEKENSYPSKNWFLFFHLQYGQSVKFKIKLLDDGQLMELVYSNLFQLQCKRICDVTVDNTSLSFLDALKSSEFSDMTIIAKNGQHFKCHKCILSCTLSDEDLDSALLSRNAEVLEAILCYMYTGFLPSNMSTERAKKVLKFAKKRKDLEDVCLKVQEFLDSTGLKNRISSLLDEIGSHLNNMCSLVEGVLATYDKKKKFFEDPSKCLYVVKELLKELSIAMLRWLLFCDLYTKNKRTLSKQDRDDILRKIVEVAVCYCNRALEIQGILEAAYEESSSDTISDLAAYMLPEVEQLLKLASCVKTDTIDALDKMIKDEKQGNSSKRKEQKGTIWKIRNVIYLREIMKLKSTFDFAEKFFGNLSAISEELKSASQSDRRSKATRNLQEFLELLFCRKEIPKAVVEHGHRKKAKVLIGITISLLARSLEIVRKQKAKVTSIIKTITNALPNEQLHPILQELGFESKNGSRDASAPDPTRSLTENENAKACENDSITNVRPEVENHLSKSLRNLLESAKYSDMEFHVSNASDSSEVVVFKAHRVVVATRCQWFSRALHSGMKESIERKFFIEGCSPEVFELFLQYLYGATVEDFENLSEEMLADLITLADRYETEDLERFCEFLLAKHLNERNVFLILSFADNIGAQQLRNSALSYIKDCAHPVEADDMEKLSNKLRDEVKLILQTDKTKQENRQGQSEVESKKKASNHVPPDASRSKHPSRFESDSTSSSTESLFLSHSPEFSNDNISTSSSDEEANDLTSFMQELRAVVGSDMPESELMQIAVNADFDLNRAVNFYFEQ